MYHAHFTHTESNISCSFLSVIHSEILRVLDSLQLFYKNNTVVTPANWKPGDKVMIHPAVKDDELPKLFPKGVDIVDMPSGVSYVRFTNDY